MADRLHLAAGQAVQRLRCALNQIPHHGLPFGLIDVAKAAVASQA
jgi:hypothetical protein